MRPAEAVLTDLYNATKKYGATDQIAFFKDIAGEEEANTLQTLVQAAGSGALQKLIGELKNVQGEANKAAKVMANNLGGDLKNLESAWEGLRIQIEETTDGPLRRLTQRASNVITAISGWAVPRVGQWRVSANGEASFPP
nr:phage tail tape measure protein [Sodalis glossinidius]